MSAVPKSNASSPKPKANGVQKSNASSPNQLKSASNVNGNASRNTSRSPKSRVSNNKSPNSKRSPSPPKSRLRQQSVKTDDTTDIKSSVDDADLADNMNALNGDESKIIPNTIIEEQPEQEEPLVNIISK